MTILSVMDTYCSNHMEDVEWNTIFTYDWDKSDLPIAEGVELTHNEENMVMIIIRIQNRSCLAERVILLLHAKITSVWALMNR